MTTNNQDFEQTFNDKCTRTIEIETWEHQDGSLNRVIKGSVAANTLAMFHHWKCIDSARFDLHTPIGGKDAQRKFGAYIVFTHLCNHKDIGLYFDISDDKLKNFIGKKLRVTIEEL